MKDIFTFRGSLNRKQFISLYIKFLIIFLFITIASVEGLPESIGIWVFSLVIIFSIIFMLSLEIKRLHDLEKSNWWCLMNLTPPTGILLLVFLSVKKGQYDNSEQKIDNL